MRLCNADCEIRCTFNWLFGREEAFELVDANVFVSVVMLLSLSHASFTLGATRNQYTSVDPPASVMALR